jgi:CheY-like chemotaxis protein
MFIRYIKTFAGVFVYVLFLTNDRHGLIFDEVLVTTEDNGNYGHIYVQDNGVGISSENLLNIFDPFFAAWEKDSLGLGLSIAYAIVKRHYGEINVSSSKDSGSVFEVRFPVACRQIIRKKSFPKKKLKDSSILLIQEEDIVKQIFAQMLIDKGCDLDQASGVPETVKLLKKRKYDLIIADTDVLFSSEKAFIKKIKKIAPDILIILLTGHIQKEKINMYDNSSEDLRIVKPLDLNKALLLISDLLMGKLNA